ncbi:MAG: response regulator transcription factor [Chloroflexi bacterium]|nr:response regulator transcription factor [Chloroflexota bacterium]
MLRLLVLGKTNQEVAEALVLTRNTVANHIKRIFDKTGAANRTEAAAFALRHDL